MYWRQNIAYVPQFITLNDSSILENIAFGTPADEISLERAIRCKKWQKYMTTFRAIEKVFIRILEKEV